MVSPGSDGVAFNRCDITMREPSLFADPASGYLEVGDIIEAWSGGQQGRCSLVPSFLVLAVGEGGGGRGAGNETGATLE